MQKEDELTFMWNIFIPALRNYPDTSFMAVESKNATQ